MAECTVFRAGVYLYSLLAIFRESSKTTYTKLDFKMQMSLELEDTHFYIRTAMSGSLVSFTDRSNTNICSVTKYGM